ncbi:transposase [Candidatus Peregrinibacteria bacterium]|nr:transposase [Candidatus Peregrinibacteria bacterium]
MKENTTNSLKKLPHNNEITKRHCDRFCGILIVDGKFVKVRGFEKKIPLLWGIDYLTHDIPIFILTASESYESWLKYFEYLKSIRYPMQIVVCDDNENIKLAARYIFPNVIIQTCQNHFLENIRRDLQVRTVEKYKPFVDDLKNELFSNKINKQDFEKKAFKLFKKYEHDLIAVSYLLRIQKYTQELTNASLVKHTPRTTNLMELYNSHLEARLKSIKGFKSFQSAQKWLNAYILRRRFRKFRSCCRKFGYLNGKTSISKTMRKTAVLPHLFV